MQFTVDKSALQKALSGLVAIVPSKASVPTIECVRVTAKAGSVRLDATDLDCSASAMIEADVSEPGSILAPAKSLADIAKRAKGDVRVSLNDTQIELASGKAKWKLPTLPVDQWPDVNSFDGATFTLHSADFKRLLDQVAWSALQGGTLNFQLQGVYLTGDGSALTAVTTTSKTMALSKHPHDAAFDGVILSNKAVAYLQRFADRVASDMTVTIGANLARFHTEGETFVCRLVDGAFPPYERVIPGDQANTVTVDAGELREAVMRVALITDDKLRTVKLDYAPDAIAVTSRGQDASAAQDEVACTLDGSPMAVGYAGQNIAAALQNLEGEINISFDNPDAASKVIPKSDPDVLYILMPVRV